MEVSYENIPRALPKGLSAKIDTIIPTLKSLIGFKTGQQIFQTNEMYNIFNMGIDIQLLLTKKMFKPTLTTLRAMDTTAYEIGEIIKDDDTPIHLLR